MILLDNRYIVEITLTTAQNDNVTLLSNRKRLAEEATNQIKMHSPREQPS